MGVAARLGGVAGPQQCFLDSGQSGSIPGLGQRKVRGRDRADIRGGAGERLAATVTRPGVVAAQSVVVPDELARARAQTAALERTIGRQALELDFFAQALQLMNEAGRRPSGPQGAPRQIGKVLWAEPGVRVLAHLFWHLAATLHLLRNPGAHETVARVLGHRSRDTVFRFDACEETKAAIARIDRDVLQLKDELRDGTGRERRQA